MDGNAVRAALESVLARGSAPPDDGGAYIWAFSDDNGIYDAGVFNATRFAIRDPERFSNWITGRPDAKLPLNPPHLSDREAIKLLPPTLQKRIKRHEKQRKDNDDKSAESAN